MDGAAQLIPHFAGYDHLPEPQRTVGALFHDFANQLAQLLPDDPELAGGLRKLLEARESFFRA